MPAPQEKQAVDPDDEKVSGSHGEQEVLPEVVEIELAGHGVHRAEPSSEYEPGEQSTQVSDAIATTASDAVPAGQRVHVKLPLTEL